MPISQVTLLRPLPNRLDDFISRLETAKSIFEKSGATVHFYRTVAGSEANAVLFTSTVDNWDAWAKAAKATEGNADYQAFERESANDPAAEIVTSGILEEFNLSS
jgi:hypothetical protein